ncbi:MAG: tRNA (guanosine(18)-2'-O)-methyltransferase TrmH [Pseudomonadota bacterium]
MTPERFALVQQKLALRQPDLTVLLEQVHKSHNFSAILRSCDAVGVFEANVVPPEGGTPLSNHTAQGAEKWVQVRRFPAMESAQDQLRSEGFQLLAAHLDHRAVDYRDVDYTRPTAVVLGAERDGVSQGTLERCDASIFIPMQGMVQSLNVSVACALILFEAQRQRMASGHYESRRLTGPRYDKTRFEWLHPTIARYCRQKGRRYPPLDENGELLEHPVKT